jgi:hypothetical protein
MCAAQHATHGCRGQRTTSERREQPGRTLAPTTDVQSGRLEAKPIMHVTRGAKNGICEVGAPCVFRARGVAAALWLALPFVARVTSGRPASGSTGR